MSQADLIDRARRGDDAAWLRLVGEHQDGVFRLAYLLLANADDAEDAAQETFVRAYQALDRFDSARPLRPWLLSIAANLARNRRRAIGRYLAAVGRFFQTREEPPVTAPPSDAYWQQQAAQGVWRAVQRLRPQDQEMIYLRYFLELSVAETAEAANLPAGTVKSRLHRALGRLRTVIETEFPDLVEQRIE
ncbi:MAG: RNA polymerase sigma factor [Anaerolineae bacterium]|nr:RNA polymerase sigma factor [Anaerolineae bacterium]